MTEAPLVSQVTRGGLVPKQNSGMNDRLDPKVYESDAPAQHRMSEDMKDLEVKVQKRRNALELTPPGHAQRPKQLAKLGSSLRDRYKMLQDLKDLEAALQTYQELVDLTPLDDSKRSVHMKTLATLLGDQYTRLGNPQDLETALQLHQAALELTPPGHERRAMQLQAFALSLRNQYNCLGNLNDLEAALKAHREALALTPLGHHKRPGQLQRFAWSLADRYDTLGDLKDLETALQSSREAVDLTPSGDSKRADRLHHLAGSLLARFIRLGDLKDVNAALDADHEALSLTPPGNAERAARLEGLGATLRARYRRLEDPKDLEAMVQVNQEAVTLTPIGHSERSSRLESLATSLIDRYRKFRDLAALEAALQNKREALDLTPPGHAERADRLEGLATGLTHRYHKLRDLKDLEDALQAHTEALSLTPPGQPKRPGQLQKFAETLMYRYRRLKNREDLDTIYKTYTESFKLPPSNPESSWSQALRRAKFAHEFIPSDRIPAFRAAFDQLPEILWLGQAISVRHAAIHRINIQGAVSTAIRACIDLTDLAAAVELLEQGLATIFQQMLELKTDANLPPGQAQKLSDLSSQLYSGAVSDPITIADERNKLLKTIRTQQGFEDFLLPKSYSLLREASKGGPVIILTSHEQGCDALVILNPEASKPIHISLPSVTLELLRSQREVLKESLDCSNVRDRGQASSSRLFGRQAQFSHKPIEDCFKDILNWLWVHVVSPIYVVLNLHGVSHGRLWWLPLGAFARLPLHACAPIDQFIHSYTSTLRSLLNAYNKKPSSTGAKLGVVGVTRTDSNGANALKGVKEEVEQITSIVKEPHINSLIGEKATVQAVTSQLQNCSWIHLACHGCQDLVDPTRSHLLLYGGNLDLDTIIRMPLPNAQFVFLAACQTAMGDAELVNESFHLGGGFITAGFQSAIGTMWSMNDEDGPTVSEIVYSHLFSDGQQPQVTQTAEALQLAVKELRRRDVSYERWVPFIHMGL
ncbi:CHAT domain-containing protein [Mycena galopus ATCC 62051]|nr:CHAT domain-containing protein [Mycena galopus ATCC 62051]